MKDTDIVIGKEYLTKEGDLYKVIQRLEKCKNFYYYLVWFQKSDNYQVELGNIICSNRIIDRSKAHIFGVGYEKGTKEEPVRYGAIGDDSYRKWRSMMQRCYKNGVGIKTYKDVWVCEEWHDYMNFRRWYFQNCDNENQISFAIDKDLFGENKRVYSPQTCCMLPNQINSCITGLRKYKKDNISLTSARTIYTLTLLINRFSSSLTERVLNKLNEYVKWYSENYRKMTGQSLESVFHGYDLKGIDLKKEKITGFIKYGFEIYEFENVEQLRLFVKKIEKRCTFQQKTSIKKDVGVLQDESQNTLDTHKNHLRENIVTYKQL